ncbi:DUF7736 domain-containing protein [Sphingobium cloacae]|uniref:DUF7736 domain-containing protein n=1 Tax=Sphingobium cloacae TaxID=120107 RepID=A0A1E1F2M3_9SPHN|nr:hypothetical protein [Sphingobium cloacae]BAV64777.1 hypothetical protein SCLO_1017370 [Sphingobium cloacae]
MEQRLAARQFTKEEAVAFAEEGKWSSLSPSERGLLQLRQDRLCMPWEKAHEGVTALLGRPVYTHEFADPDSLWAEANGAIPKAQLSDVLAKLSPDALILAVVK